MGPNKPKPKDIKKQYALRVSRDRLTAALEWLFEHNDFYRRLRKSGKISISRQNLAQYPGGKGAVVDSIIKNAIYSEVAVGSLGADSSSVARPDSSDGTPLDAQHPPHKDPQGTHWSHTGTADVEGQGVSPDILQRFLDSKLKPELRKTTKRSRVLVMPGGSTVHMLNYNDPDVDHGAFPTLFPYGVCGPTYGRPQPISLDRYMRRLMHLADRRFAQHPPFCFTMFSASQRMKLCMGATRKLEAGRFMDFSAEFDKLQPEKIQRVLDNLHMMEHRGKCSNLGKVTDENQSTAQAILSLFNKVTSLGGIGLLPRCPASKRRARSEINGMYIKLGLPDLFITVNPEDRHAPLVVHFNGKHKVALGLDDPDMPDNLPRAFDRFRLVVNDGLAAVQFSATVMDAFIATLLGFAKRPDDAYKEPVGLFGDVRAYHFNDEEQGRGSLHYHGLVWLKYKPDTATFEKNIRQREFQQRLLKYLSAVIKNELPCQWNVSELRLSKGEVLQLPEDIQKCRPACYLRECKGKRHDNYIGPGSRMTFETRATDDHLSCKRVGDPYAPGFWRNILNELVRLVPQTVFHLESHTKSCFKDRRNQMLHRSRRKCRFDKPGELNEEAHFDHQGNIKLRRRHHWCGSYNPWMLACLRCNHDVTSMWGYGSKHMAVIMYITNYITKLNQKLLNQLPLIIAAVKQFKLWRDPKTSNQRQTYTLLKLVHSYLQRDVELSFQSVVHTMAGYQERYISHNPTKLHTVPFLLRLEQDDDERGCYDCSYDELPDSESRRKERLRVTKTKDLPADDKKNIFVHNDRLDYELRPAGLDNCCLYDYTVCWYKVRRPRATKAQKEMMETTADEEAQESDSTLPLGQEPDSNEMPAVETLNTGEVFQFAKGHPQREYWGVKFRKNHVTWFATINGPIIRNRVRAPHHFARQMLLLFKPFRHVNELRPTGLSWIEAWQDYETTLSPRLRRYVQNLEAIDNHRRAWEADIKEREKEINAARKAGLFEERRPDNPHFSDGEIDSDDDIDDFSEYNVELPQEDGDLKETNFLLFDTYDAKPELRVLYNAVHGRGLFDMTTKDATLISDADPMAVERPVLAPPPRDSWFQLASTADWTNATLNKKHLDVLSDRALKRRFNSSEDEFMDDQMDLKEDSSQPSSEGEHKTDKESTAKATKAAKSRTDKRHIVQQPFWFGVDTTPDEICRAHKLNERQAMAFYLVADTLMQEIAAETKPIDNVRPRQLKMYVGGAGGTGKTKVIEALQQLFEAQNRPYWLRTCGPTGSAAVNVKGSTLFSLLGVNPRGGSQNNKQDSEANRHKVRHRLQDVKFLFIDEISMVGANYFCDMETNIKAAFGTETDLPWAGLHIVTFGDFAQLRPVGKKSVGDANAGNPSPSHSKPDFDSDDPRAKLKPKKQKPVKGEDKYLALANRTGRQLWMDFDTVIFLEENMRFMGDPAYGAMMHRLRHGKSECCCQDHLHVKRGPAAVHAIAREAPVACRRKDKPCDYHLLRSRVLQEVDVTSGSKAAESTWKAARIISHSNPVSAAWNRDAVCQLASQNGEPVLVSLAEDSLSGDKDPLTAREQRRLRKLPDSKCGTRLSALPLTVGMRVIVRFNIATELGVVNGAEGTLVKIVLDDEEEIPPQLLHNPRRGGKPVIRQLRHLPAYVVVRFDDITLPEKLPGTTSAHEVTIIPDKVQYTCELRGKPHTVYRKQLPLTPTRCMTIHMAQGRTLEPLVADANMGAEKETGHKPKHKEKHTKLYVMLSRCRSLQGLALLRHFHHAELHAPVDKWITDEIRRLKNIESITIARFKRRHPDGFVYAPPITKPTSSDGQDLRDKARDSAEETSEPPVFPTDYAVQLQAEANYEPSTRSKPSRKRCLDEDVPGSEQTEAHDNAAKRHKREQVSPAKAPTSTSSSTNFRPWPAGTWCAPELKLSHYDRLQIKCLRYLNDDIIRAFHRLIRLRFPAIKSLQAPAIGAAPAGYTTTPGFAVQIHHDGGLHWLTSARTADGIFVADSLQQRPSPDTIQQLVDIYHDGQQQYIWITYIPCQRQPNPIQCGDFAIAWAGMFAEHIHARTADIIKVFGKAHLNAGSMRSHIMHCLEQANFSPFPQVTVSARKGSCPAIPRKVNTLTKPIVYCINCLTKDICTVPEVGQLPD